MNWQDYIEAVESSMAGGTTCYTLENLYQAFKERLLKETTTNKEGAQNEPRKIPRNSKRNS